MISASTEMPWQKHKQPQIFQRLIWNYAWQRIMNVPETQEFTLVKR